MQGIKFKRCPFFGFLDMENQKTRWLPWNSEVSTLAPNMPPKVEPRRLLELRSGRFQLNSTWRSMLHTGSTFPGGFKSGLEPHLLRQEPGHSQGQREQFCSSFCQLIAPAIRLSLSDYNCIFLRRGSHKISLGVWLL